MKLTVKKHGGIPFSIHLPAVVCLRLARTSFLKGYIPELNNIHDELLTSFIDALKLFKKHHKNFILVEVESKDGEIIEITL